MTDQVLLAFDKFFFELRYPPSLLYQDHVGTIAHTAQSVFREVELAPTEVVAHEGNPDEPSMRISPTTSWFSAPEGTRFADFLMWVRPIAERVLGEYMGVEEVRRVGLRGYSLLAMPTVDEGVGIFRAIADHRGPPFSVLAGEPSGVRLELRTSGWATIEGFSFNLTAFVAPIRLPETVQERLADGPSAEWEGGLLIDLDAALAEGQVMGVGSALQLADVIAERLSGTVDDLVEALPKENDELRARVEGD